MTRFAGKAEIYQRTRWDYSSEAIDFVFSTADLGIDSTVADIGAGTGILTRHFAGRVGTLYAVEPDANMMGILRRQLSDTARLTTLARYADFIPEIPAGSVDAIVVAHALHWFDYEPTLAEFVRITRAGGLLFAVSNSVVGPGNLSEETARLFRTHRVRPVGDGKSPEPDTGYFRIGGINEASFDFDISRDFDTFVGSLVSASFMPGPEDARYAALEKEARLVFERFACDDELVIRARTTVRYGELRAG